MTWVIPPFTTFEPPEAASWALQYRTAWRTPRSAAASRRTSSHRQPTMRPMGVPLRRRSRTSKQMCHPAAPIEMKRRSMLCHSVRRVPPAEGFEFPPDIAVLKHLGSVGSRHCCFDSACGVPTQVRFTVVPAVPRLPSASKGAHSRRCAGSVSACQTFSGEWRSSLTRMSVHFSPSFRTSRPAGRTRCVLLAIDHPLLLLSLTSVPAG